MSSINLKIIFQRYHEINSFNKLKIIYYYNFTDAFVNDIIDCME